MPRVGERNRAGEALVFAQHAPAAAISFAAGIGGVAVFPLLRPGVRAPLALAFGVLALMERAVGFFADALIP